MNQNLKNVTKRFIPKPWRSQMLDAYYDAVKYIAYRNVKQRKEPFYFHGEAFPYYSHHHNWTYLNERTVELPIAFRYLEEYKEKKILKVGNVLSHYMAISHLVIDKFEKAGGVVNVDIVNFAPAETFDLVISISTFEHIGYDENRFCNVKDVVGDHRQLLRAIEHTKQLLAPNGIFLLTVPLAYNPFLDNWICENRFGMSDVWFMKRVSRNNKWKQVSFDEMHGVRYRKGLCWGAEGLCIMQYKNNVEIKE